MWDGSPFSEGLRHASPHLALQVDALLGSPSPRPRDVRKASVSTVRYLLRAGHRATPFGLFAGVTTAAVGDGAGAVWGEEHTVVARPSAEWLASVVARLENYPELLLRLPVVATGTLMVRGDRLVLPYTSDTAQGRPRAVEASLRLTGPVRAALSAARTPSSFDTVAACVLNAFPEAGADKVTGLLRELIRLRVLITSLHAPSTETNALGHLLDRLNDVDAGSIPTVAGLVGELRQIQKGVGQGPREAVTVRMRSMAPGLRRHPLALDVRLDAEVALPAEVAREAERAALLLTRVSSAPYGTAAWKAYHMRFYERFGIGTMVPLLDVVSDSGIGFPDGYPGAVAGERRPRLSERDEVLVRIAQRAALDGHDEVVLDEALIAELESGPVPPRIPPHLELGFQVQARSSEELERGRFRLRVVSVSRGAGVGVGRFLSVVAPQDRERLITDLADLPTADRATVAAQLSFPPLLPESAHVTRTPQVLPVVISLDEHRDPKDGVLGVQDLTVGCDGRRMYLAVPSLGHRVEALGMHPLNLHTHTPPLVRFLTELSRAQCAQVTVFDWGAAAAMPFLPRLRHGRIVLSPAHWRLERSELPSHGGRQGWNDAFGRWCAARRVPRHVQVGDGDRLLALDLSHAGHRVLLREQLDQKASVVLTEAEGPDEFGWCGGRAHEIVLPLKATAPPAWPPLPAPAQARIARRDQVHTPAASPVLLAGLYGDIRRQDTLLADHLPDLLDRLGHPLWWFVRFRDPDQHLRVRIALPTDEAFTETARTVSTWAEELRDSGLLSDLRYPTSYRETGRWGSGPAWAAAEEVFRADSRAVLTQLGQPQRPERRALVAAHTVAIASAFLGGPESGMRWLIDHVPATAPARVPRSRFSEAVRLADPSGDWAVLRSMPGGEAIVEAWSDRDRALAAYRPHLSGPDTEGIALDDVLTSLLHVHFVRHVAVDFPEEEICLYLARAAALAWTARRTS
ncbi:lantibiotic dehydratase [Streptomyces sp. NPDC088757]|uniref:lantibiotic dehydratase n=1 Tax=Streptomyces sp. NPDC088757 TaxID=3365889 RepID=UPI003811A911